MSNHKPPTRGSSGLAEAGRAEPFRLLGDRYELRARLGRGGMADVFLARDTLLERDVAIKMLRGVGRSVDRFRREAVVLASMRSNHVVSLLDAQIDVDHVYLVMEYVHGRSLHQILAAHGAMTPARAVRLLGQVLDGLTVLHASRFVHRDVKPANILVDWDERAVLVDLGLVFDPRRPSLTPADSTAGTLSYMAPEQRVSNVVDSRTDLYQVGMVLLYCLTGVDPSDLGGLPDEHIPELIGRTPAPLARVLARALSPEAGQRFASASEMKKALTVALQQITPSRGQEAAVYATGSHAFVAMPEPPADAVVAQVLVPRRRWPVIVGVAVATVALACLAAGALAGGAGLDGVGRAPEPIVEVPAIVVAVPPSELDPRDPLLAEAVAHERAGDLAAAIDAYRRFLRSHPDSADAAAVRLRLAALH